MRTLGLIALFGLVVSGTAAQDKPGTSDKDKLQGTWSIESMKMGGKDMPAEELKKVKLTFTGDKVIVKADAKNEEHTYTLDAAKKPKQIDITAKAEVIPGIYELDGDTLKIATAHKGGVRPTDFNSQDGSMVGVMVLKRDKADKK